MFKEMQRSQLRHEGVLLIDHANARNDNVNIKPSDTQSGIHVTSQEKFLKKDDRWQRDIHRYRCVLILNTDDNFPYAKFDMDTLAGFRDPYALMDIQGPRFRSVYAYATHSHSRPRCQRAAGRAQR